MIGAAIFLIFFLLFTVISLVIPLPPGTHVHQWFGIPQNPYSNLINAVTNGIIYGVIIWFVYSIAKYAYEKKKEKGG